VHNKAVRLPAASEIARLRTPGLHAGNAGERVERQDALNFDRLSSTPSQAAAPAPDKPVPAPRATTGTFARRHSSRMSRHLLFGFRQRNRQRHLAISDRPSRLERLEVFLLVQHGIRRENFLQLLNKLLFIYSFHILHKPSSIHRFHRLTQINAVLKQLFIRFISIIFLNLVQSVDKRFFQVFQKVIPLHRNNSW